MAAKILTNTKQRSRARLQEDLLLFAWLQSTLLFDLQLCHFSNCYVCDFSNCYVCSFFISLQYFRTIMSAWIWQNNWLCLMIGYQPTLMVMLTLSPQSWNYITVGPSLVLHCDVIITLTLVHIHHINLKKCNFSILQGFKCFLCLSLEYLLEIVMN